MKLLTLMLKMTDYLCLVSVLQNYSLFIYQVNIDKGQNICQIKKIVSLLTICFWAVGPCIVWRVCQRFAS